MLFYKIYQNLLFFWGLQSKFLTSACDIDKIFQTNIDVSIDHTIDPCENFYAYACGNYGEHHTSNYYSEITTQMDYKFDTFIANLMETCYQYEYQKPDHCQTFVEKARVYLKSCLWESKRDVVKYFDYIKPGPQLEWPLWLKGEERKSWPEGEFNKWKFLGELHSYGFNNVLINQIVLVDREGKFSIKMEPAYVKGNSTLLEDNFLRFLLLTLKAKLPQKDFRNLKETDRKLMEIYEKYESVEEEVEFYLKDLRKQFTNLDLDSFVKELVQRDLPGDTLVTLRNPHYFQYLNEQFDQEFEPSEICNYLMMTFLTYLAKDSTSEFKSLACVKDLRNKMDLAVNYLYYHENYRFRARLYNATVNEIFHNIILQYDQLFHRNNLNLTSEQLKFLLDKLHNIALNIGNLPQDVSFDMVNRFYEHVPPLDKRNYYKNHLHLLRHRFNSSLVCEQNQSRFIVYNNIEGSSSGAFYVAKQNMIILPFGSLTKPMFNAHSHDLYKYSLLGFILAHELTHAFETNGLNYNSQGDLLFTPESDILYNENYQNSLQCLQSQLPTENIDERIADIVAIELVYNAYKSRRHNSKKDKNFFLNLAQFFCGKSNINFVDHDTDAERLHQIVMNSPGFAKAFKCRGNSTMNPIKKCRLY